MVEEDDDDSSAAITIQCDVSYIIKMNDHVGTLMIVLPVLLRAWSCGSMSYGCRICPFLTSTASCNTIIIRIASMT